jgi:hypothetical protein
MTQARLIMLATMKRITLRMYYLREGCFPIAGRHGHAGWRLCHSGPEQLQHA